MNTKKMREKLKLEGHTPARSNTDMKAQYKELFPPKPRAETKPSLNVVQLDNQYTYIGGGESAPAITNFMGKQVFRLGELTKVTDQDVLAKIKNNPTFKKGPVTAEEIFDANKKLEKRVNEQIQVNINLQAHMDRKNAKG